MTDGLEELMTGYYGMDTTSSSSTDLNSSSFDLSNHLTTLLRTSTYSFCLKSMHLSFQKCRPYKFTEFSVRELYKVHISYRYNT